MNSQKLSSIAPVVLRLSLAGVFMWFGISQIVNAGAWTSLVPEWATGIFGMTSVTIVNLNGVFEIIAAMMLAIGIYVRPVATLLAIHLFVITTHLGINAIGVRDFGLSFATLAVALLGTDKYCVGDNTLLVSK